MIEAINAVLATAHGNYKLIRPAFIDGWSIATDGKRMFAFHGEIVENFTHPEFPKVCRKWIEEAPECIPVNAARFLAFIGQTAPTPGKCERCDGEGSARKTCSDCRETHDCECQACDGDGRQEYKARIVKIGMALVDSYILADVLAHVPPVGDWQVSVPRDDGRCQIAGENWKLIFMPMNPRTVSGEGVPEWTL